MDSRGPKPQKSVMQTATLNANGCWVKHRPFSFTFAEPWLSRHMRSLSRGTNYCRRYKARCCLIQGLVGMKSHIWDHVWLASATVKSNQSIPWNRRLAIWADLNPRISKSPTCRNVFTTKISASPKVKTGFAWNVIASAVFGCDSLVILVADWVSEPNRRFQRQLRLLIMLCWKMLEGLLGSAPPWGPPTLDIGTLLEH